MRRYSCKYSSFQNGSLEAMFVTGSIAPGLPSGGRILPSGGSAMEQTERIRTIGGSAVLASLITGVAGLIMAWTGTNTASAIALVAAAIAFTGISNAIFRR